MITALARMDVGVLNVQEVEESVKARTKGESITLGSVNMAAKTLCMPFEQDNLPMVSNTLAEGNLSAAFFIFVCF